MRCPPHISNALISQVAKRVMREIGACHSEATYQRAIVHALAEKGVPSQIEVPIPYMKDGICIGLGRGDILLESHLIEVKVAKSMHASENLWKGNKKMYVQQISKYMQAMQQTGAKPRTGAVICYDQCLNKVHITFLRKLGMRQSRNQA
jgi:GxxExxY protein